MRGLDTERGISGGAEASALKRLLQGDTTAAEELKGTLSDLNTEITTLKDTLQEFDDAPFLLTPFKSLAGEKNRSDLKETIGVLESQRDAMQEVVTAVDAVSDALFEKREKEEAGIGITRDFIKRTDEAGESLEAIQIELEERVSPTFDRFATSVADADTELAALASTSRVGGHNLRRHFGIGAGNTAMLGAMRKHPF